MTDSLPKMGDKRLAEQASLRRALKPMLGTAASDESIGVALDKLIARAIVAIAASGAVTYPQLGKDVEAGVGNRWPLRSCLWILGGGAWIAR